MNDEKGCIALAIVLWLVYAVLFLAFWGFICWAIYTVVTK